MGLAAGVTAALKPGVGLPSEVLAAGRSLWNAGYLLTVGLPPTDVVGLPLPG